MNELTSHSIINFDGCEYFVRQTSDTTWQIFNADDRLIADGVLALSDEPLDDIYAAIVNATEEN